MAISRTKPIREVKCSVLTGRLQRASGPRRMAFWEERRFPSGVDGPGERARLVREAGARLSDDDDMVSSPIPG